MTNSIKKKNSKNDVKKILNKYGNNKVNSISYKIKNTHSIAKFKLI